MRMSLRWITTALVLGLVLPTLPATAQPAIPDTATWVRQQDRNGDGKIDREEFHRAAVEAFFLRDKDKNGSLAIDELKEASPEALKAVKRKDSARISVQEYVNALFKDFEAADTDGDGLLSVDEITRYRQRTR
jgi:Ca2+-binding EF-hand superfamily protein